MSILEQTTPDKQKAEQEQFDSSQLLLDLFKHLTEKEKDILKCRFGLLGNIKETLEKIGSRHKITRERVRQIQVKALNKLKKIKNLKEFLKPLENRVIHFLEEYGQIAEEEFFLNEFLGKFQKNFQEDQIDRRNFIFILSHLSRMVERREGDALFKVTWHLKGFFLEELRLVLEKVENIFREKGHPLKEKELISYFLEIDENHFLSYLRTSNKVEKDIFGQWGLVSWPEVRPKKLKDKIYLILKREKKPLHFEKITEKVNEQFKEKINQAPTVHNELILDKRLVLVGRGIYGLQEQGYKPGVVADVVIDILKRENRPMGWNELIEAVLKQRLVKRQTVAVALATLVKEGKVKKKRSSFLVGCP